MRKLLVSFGIYINYNGKCRMTHSYCFIKGVGMATERDHLYRKMAARGKYQRLYTHLHRLSTQEWRTTFSELESIIGFPLPPSARLHRSWWSNQTVSNSRSGAFAWGAAGWETADVDMDAETLLLRRKSEAVAHTINLDEVLPVHSVGAWPENLSLRREDMYK